jgi:hypothetical protein
MFLLDPELSILAIGFSPTDQFPCDLAVNLLDLELGCYHGVLRIYWRVNVRISLSCGNPLEDIRNTRKIESVITNGVMYDCAKLWPSVGFTP